MICTNFLGRHVSSSDKLGPFIVIYYGIGVKKARMFCKLAGLPYNTAIYPLEGRRMSYLESLIYRVNAREYVLRRLVSGNLYFKYSSSTKAGLRLSQGLPSRNQRSKTNASTAKRIKIDFSKFSK